MQSSRSFLLDLPLELRLNVYEYALADADAITISTAIVDATVPIATPESSPKATIPGLPSNHVPLVRCHYDAALLSISDPPTQAVRAASFTDSGFFEAEPEEPEPSCLPHPTSLSLLQTCHQIHDELEFHIYRRANAAKRAKTDCEADDISSSRTTHVHGGLSLYVSYPYGILVLKHHYPHLLQQARSIHVCGYFVSHKPNAYNHRRSSVSSTTSTISNSSQGSEASDCSNESASASGNSKRKDGPLARHPLSAVEAAHDVLGALVRQVLAIRTSPLLKMIQMRIFYPDQAAYTHVWGDDLSPIGEGMRNIRGGEIDLEVWRGGQGTGVDMTARPNPDRKLTSVWKTLSEKKEESEAFVVDERWPDWEKCIKLKAPVSR